MARKVFVAATGQNSGKTTTSVSLKYMARKKYERVGFIKPLGPKPTVASNGMVADKDAALMAEVFGLEDDLALMSPVVLMPGDTQKILDGEVSGEDLEQKILAAIDELDRKNDFLIIEGAGHTGVGSVIGSCCLSHGGLQEVLHRCPWRGALSRVWRDIDCADLFG